MNRLFSKVQICEKVLSITCHWRSGNQNQKDIEKEKLTNAGKYVEKSEFLKE